MVNLNQIYQWRKLSAAKYPWERQFLNVEFYKYEQKRLKDAFIWYEIFQKKPVGAHLPEVYYYVAPIELEPKWKAAIAIKGKYQYKGLSALKNCHQAELLMLFPIDKKAPEDYSLIRITQAKKEVLYNEKDNQVEWILLVEEFEEADSSVLYLDVPYEKKEIFKFIKENIINDDIIAGSYQPTISGSPYVVNSKGGISTSTFAKYSTFADEFMNTLKMMQPIEFSDLTTDFPKTISEGKSFSPTRGFTFHVAERAVLGNNFFSSFSTSNYQKLNNELFKRAFFKGEYSIACTLIPRGDNVSAFLRDIFSKFIKTEVMNPFNIDELKFSDVDLTRAQKNINEDLWIQIANQKQLRPVLDEDNQNIMTLRKKILSEWQSVIETLGIKKHAEHEAGVYCNASLKNIRRVAQSIARDHHQNKVDTVCLDNSFKLFKENIHALASNPDIQRHVKIIIPEREESTKFNAVRAELSVNILPINELFENVKEYFADIYELQEFIDKKLLPRGYLYEPKQGYYQWI